MKYILDTTKKVKAIKAQFLSGVEFGVPSKKCLNFGICRITPLGRAGRNSEKRHKHCGEAVFTIWENDRIEMSVLIDSLSSRSLKKYFSTRMFTVDEDFHSQELGEKKSMFIIRKGKYPIEVNNNFITVYF